MEEELRIPVDKRLVEEINKISREYHITKDEWLRTALKSAIRQEPVREKIMDTVSKEFEEGKITFTDMVMLVGDLNARKIKSVVEGSKKSFKEAERIK